MTVGSESAAFAPASADTSGGALPGAAVDASPVSPALSGASADTPPAPPVVPPVVPPAAVASSAAPSASSAPQRDPKLPFFTNRDCPYFPCHPDVDPDNFNCLFCFCPLYTLGEACGGRYTYTASGTKSCVNCPLPHRGNDGNAMVRQRFAELAERAAIMGA